MAKKNEPARKIAKGADNYGACGDPEMQVFITAARKQGW